MTPRARCRPGLLAVGLALGLVAGPAVAAPLTDAGRRAYDAARSADDGATAAFEEGEKTLALIKELAPERDAVPPALKPYLDESESAHQALDGYRRLTQAATTDTLGILAEVTKIPDVPTTDLVRRSTLEQHALLSAHEAAVMAARTRTEAERLRAILAEARLAMAEGGGANRSARVASPNPPARASGDPAPEPMRRGDTVVPNLVGARLDAATRDLEAAGLRLGAVIGPRDGFVVKQSPEAGGGAPRQSAVSVTLSAAAATMGPPR